MKVDDAIRLFERSGKRCLLVGDSTAGVLAGLDLEGRLWAVRDGEILNRFNPEAVAGRSTASRYFNPGGDGLWPAPEGTRKGYEYSTGRWRVPPSLVSARFEAVETRPGGAEIEAEVDLINDLAIGLPTTFNRAVSVTSTLDRLVVKVVESIRYLGSRPLAGDQALLAPWSLCQFDCGPGDEGVLPAAGADVWDLYDPSEKCRFEQDGLIHAGWDSSRRYQIGIGKATPWIELRMPRRNLVVRRSASPIAGDCSYIDIADAPPEIEPSARETRYSVYSDPSGFMEIEAAGGCPRRLEPGVRTSVETITEYRKSVLTCSPKRDLLT